VKENINHPCNAFNAQADAREAYDKLAWGIEAIQVGNKVIKLLLIEDPVVNYFCSGNISSAKSALMRSLLLSDLQKDRKFLSAAASLQTGPSPNPIQNIATSNSLSLA
jgi:hypothetical protein